MPGGGNTYYAPVIPSSSPALGQAGTLAGKANLTGRLTGKYGETLEVSSTVPARHGFS